MKRKVFLPHNRPGKPAAEAPASRLYTDSDIDSRLDKWNLVLSQRWQEELEVAIKGCGRCWVSTGRGDPQNGVIGPWRNAEMRALIDGHALMPDDFNRRGRVFAGEPG